MNDTGNCSTERLICDLMLAALRVQDKLLNGIATQLFVRMGEATIRRLVLAAVNRKNTPGHRIRILHTISRLEATLDPTSFMDLSTLLHDRNAKVRQAAADLIGFFPGRELDGSFDRARSSQSSP